jgi:hypothetical protein
VADFMITSVRVGRLKTGSGYNNYRVEVEAALQAGEDLLSCATAFRRNWHLRTRERS